MTSTYDIIKEGFKKNPGRSRLEFKHPQVQIEAHIDRSKNGSNDLIGVWFHLLAREPITEEQVQSAIALFHPHSNYDGGGFTHYTETRKLEDSLSLDQIPSFYASKRDQLRSISDNPPTCKGLSNDDFIDGPVEVPDHKWGSVYCAFENSIPENPEFGYSWNSIVLYKDGMALRIAKQANFMHAISPTLADITEKLDDKNDDEYELAIMQIAQFALEQDKITSEKDIFGLLRDAPQPLIIASELNDVATYVSGIVGRDVSSLEYQVE